MISCSMVPGLPGPSLCRPLLFPISFSSALSFFNFFLFSSHFPLSSSIITSVLLCLLLPSHHIVIIVTSPLILPFAFSCLLPKCFFILSASVPSLSLTFIFSLLFHSSSFFYISSPLVSLLLQIPSSSKIHTQF